MPLYLSAISKEITRVIDAGTIDEKILPLINTTNLQQLYLQILSRLEKDYGQKPSLYILSIMIPNFKFWIFHKISVFIVPFIWQTKPTT